ncbi:uncharacterized protein M421DRAFT_235807 [Didymella exigua CBS 183.55]|uniref:Uncharacterized protein n=1 Tax=Didymella exigua CBS 183.55 TaxID=1150837 RepID=A0A6A5RJA8_9PLEO|nr:uncharacterized protein M421DRAFT_235807 [Didymella exigua CBS 183.55]KAF1925687.1 hypothetical protein M421DRAFT_235807 [Didymella exigua CBS 183.55]
MAPPSAALEDGTFNVVGCVKPFTSASSGNSIPQSLMLTCFFAFLAYNIAFFFGIDLPAIVNFGTTVYQALINWIAMIRQQGIQRTSLNIVNSFRTWVTSTYRSSMNAHAFRTGLKRMVSNPGERLGQTIPVDTVTVPGTGSLALVRGLSSNVSTPEIRRYLESILFIHYGLQLNDSHTVRRNGDRTVDGYVPEDTDDAPINTYTPGLWNGTCVRPKEETADTPSTSGMNTPTSKASDSSALSVDLTLDDSTSGTESVALDDLAAAAYAQGCSRFRRAE